ncbi:LysR family transcriptional regulator [Phreatobacter aquaticus]|uniref:LysR family transcriptional regulator n=1 Tax=Phreatobacter aquaticus TaxID=2570229 RepID=A0A4D7QNV0_9HYPH|nr:LysR family transcriptional regulator [Phreatobacter aquaticus]QCK87583.1 LysR family transcriptional regulator [Phreatobacter aquaticus]
MELDAFRLFVAVVDHGSIAAAAQSLGISPSLASRRIAALERAVKLFAELAAAMGIKPQ